MFILNLKTSVPEDIKKNGFSDDKIILTHLSPHNTALLEKNNTLSYHWEERFSSLQGEKMTFLKTNTDRARAQKKSKSSVSDLAYLYQFQCLSNAKLRNYATQ